MFHPNLSALPEPQRKLWPRLSKVPGHFVLYGGTAIALQLGHRVSVDYDFFSTQAFSGAQLERDLTFLRLPKTVVQDLPNTYSVAFKQELEGANISFFGTQDYGQTATPLIADGNGIKVAALIVMLAMKLKVLHERVAAKDYLDVAALVRAGISLEDGLSHLEALFPNSINPALTMQTLTYFKGGDLDTLPDDVKHDLEAAVSRVRKVPPFAGAKMPIGFCSAKPQ